MPNDANPWRYEDEPAFLGDPDTLVTLVNGHVFCISDRAGDVRPSAAHGLFVADFRAVCHAVVTIDDHLLEPLGVSTTRSYAATYVSRPAAGAPRHALLVVRRREIGSVTSEVVELRNYSVASVQCDVRVRLDSDFADIFAVKENRVVHEGARSEHMTDRAMHFAWELGEVQRMVSIDFADPPSGVSRDGVRWHVRLEPGACARLAWTVSVAFGDAWLSSNGDDAQSTARRRYDEWQANTPQLRTSFAPLTTAFDQSVRDLGSLRLFDPDPSERNLPVVAAGAPWFMTLFGRDSLITGLMTLLVDHKLALGVLRALAREQGSSVDPLTEEEPGRILHETRFLGAAAPTIHAGRTYYGSVDSTPLFVVLLGELSRWGVSERDLLDLLPHADRALAWAEDYGDRDGDGYIEYQKASRRGLANQGWKDSGDGIRYRDGAIAEGPIALCEVQGYLFAAYRARAHLARRVGDEPTAARMTKRAGELKVAFNRDFWIPELGWFAVGLGPDKGKIDSLTSNIGHCLWSGIVDDDKADAVVGHLMSEHMWTGWGIRTLSADTGGYAPTSYHCGSVWPHDNALCAMGMAQYGFRDEANRVAVAQLLAAQHWNGRLPELFCGLDRADIDQPVSFPTSCSPQAWAAASPLFYLRMFLGLDPDVPNGRLRVSPHFPREISDLSVRAIRLVDQPIDVELTSAGFAVHAPRGSSLAIDVV